MTHVTCRLTVKNRDQLCNPMLGSRVWATFTFSLSLQQQLKILLKVLFHNTLSVNRNKFENSVLNVLVAHALVA